HLVFRHALDRKLDVAETEGWIIARAVRVEIECADLAMRACTQGTVFRHLRIGPGRRARWQWSERTELAIGIAIAQRAALPLRLCADAFSSSPNNCPALAAKDSRAMPSARSA